MCGFVGIVDQAPVAPSLCLGLHTLQHRGQDAAGIGTLDERGSPHLRKAAGLVSAVFPDGGSKLPGNIGVGHVRYPTWGGKGSDEAQPYLNRWPTLLVAHNGNLTGLPEEARDRSDTEWLLRKLMEPGQVTLSERIRHLMESVTGAYSVIGACVEDGAKTLFGIRDPNAIRPLVYGERDGAWMIASETVALETLGFRHPRHLHGGGAVYLRYGQDAVAENFLPEQPRHCVFERIYLARPDAKMEEGRVIATRGRLGEQLAEEWDIEADVIVPVPDTSRPAATAMAEYLGIPVREGFIKNRYSQRTFIMPDQTSREAAMKLKLNTIREVFEGRRVVLVDDSIVRGTTMRKLVDMVWACDPTEVHVAVMSPPVKHPCHYGINMRTYQELIAARRNTEQIRKQFGSTSVTYLSMEGLYKVAGERICAACFGGDPPVR